MHLVVGRVLGMDRQECPRPHMQRHLVHADAARREPGQQLIGEMQARSRRRDRAFVAREQGLVVGAVLLVGLAPARDIGRQRHVAALGNGLVQHRPVKGERQRDLAALALGFDRSVELAKEADLALVAEADDVARRELLRRPHEGAPARAVEPLGQGRLDLRLGVAADAPAGQPRRDHARVVDHKRIAGIEQVRQIAHALVFKLRRATRPHHQHRAASRGTTGRSAMRSGGRSKSNRSVRMTTFVIPGAAKRRAWNP